MYFSGAERYLDEAEYNYGTGPIHLRNLVCPENANELDDCTYEYHYRDANGGTICWHGEDVSVECVTNEPEPQPSDRRYKLVCLDDDNPEGWRQATCEEVRQDHDRLKQMMSEQAGPALTAQLANGKVHGVWKEYTITDFGPSDFDEGELVFGMKMITTEMPISETTEAEVFTEAVFIPWRLEGACGIDSVGRVCRQKRLKCNLEKDIYFIQQRCGSNVYYLI